MAIFLLSLFSGYICADEYFLVKTFHQETISEQFSQYLIYRGKEILLFNLPKSYFEDFAKLFPGTYTVLYSTAIKCDFYMVKTKSPVLEISMTVLDTIATDTFLVISTEEDLLWLSQKEKMKYKKLDTIIQSIKPAPVLYKPANEDTAVIQNVITTFTISDLQTYISSLQNFQTRYYSTAGCLQARDYIVTKFQQFGLTTTTEAFINNNYYNYNISAKINNKW